MDLYTDQIEGRLASFVVDRREMAIREDKCANSELETARLGGKIDALKVVVKEVEGERDDLKGLVEMMTRERTELHRRRDDLSREGEGNRAEIVGLRFVKVQAKGQGGSQCGA